MHGSVSEHRTNQSRGTSIHIKGSKRRQSLSSDGGPFLHSCLSTPAPPDGAAPQCVESQEGRNEHASFFLWWLQICSVSASASLSRAPAPPSNTVLTETIKGGGTMILEGSNYKK